MAMPSAVSTTLPAIALSTPPALPGGGVMSVSILRLSPWKP